MSFELFLLSPSQIRPTPTDDAGADGIRIPMLSSLKKKIHGFLKRIVLEAINEALDLDATNVKRHLNRLAAESSAAFVLENMSLEKSIDHRDRLFDVCIDQSPKEGLILEFGVFQGQSLRYLGDKVHGRQVYGFDSFEGLPEPWIFDQPGLFKLAAGELPKVPPNVTLVKGWFNETLPGFLESHPGPIAFLHIDSDLYSSCRCVLETVSDRIVPGTVIMFDEYFNYPGWERGEHKAFREWLAASHAEFEFVGHNALPSPQWWSDGSTGQQVAVKILKKAGNLAAAG